MKKLRFLPLFLLLVIGCSKDDDVTVPQCAKPTGLTAEAITFNSATVNWNDNNTATSFTVEYGVSGFSIGSGTTVNSTNASTVLSGLQANTTYTVYVKAICSTANTSMYSEGLNFTTAAPLVVPQLLPNLSQLHIFSGALENLTPSVYTFTYELNTPLFTDYAHKQRIIALPPGTTMDYVDNGFPDFPDNTLIAKTFYYNNDERNEALGKKIIETRILIKQNGVWELGNYKWNDAQTEAVLDNTTSTVPVSYINAAGVTENVDYVVPSAQDCRDCHTNSSVTTPIGPKLRSLNFNNQLQDFIDNNYVGNLTDASSVTTLPNWEDTSYTMEERSRAYFDVNCAHCHSDGGFCELQSELRLTYETPFAESFIYERRASIDSRMGTYSELFSMPLIGTTMIHDEGYSLIRTYLNSL